MNSSHDNVAASSSRVEPSAESLEAVASEVLNFIEQRIVQKYRGEAQFQRLFWMIHILSSSSFLKKKEPAVAEDMTNMSSYPLRVATVFCINTVQQQRNVVRYKELYHQHIQTNPHLQTNHAILNGSKWIVPSYDFGWVQSNEHAILQQRELLSLRLQTAQSHMNKDAMRIAYMNLSLYYLHTYVNYKEALNMALRSKEYCTTRYQNTIHTILILVIALYLRNFQLMDDYMRRMNHIFTSTVAISASTDFPIPLSQLQYKIGLLSALERLSMGDYHRAAEKFREVAMNMTEASNANRGHSNTSSTASMLTPSMEISGGNYSTIESMIEDESWDQLVVAPDDVAIYAALLTLAVEDDRSIGIAFADHPVAIACFERAPMVRDILHTFYKRSNYKETWELLEKHVFPRMQYDIFLQHVNTFTLDENKTHLHCLQNMIRTKAILFYWNAYQQCPLMNMMESLGSGITGTDDLLQFQGLILQLLKNRFRRPESVIVTGVNKQAMALPMDTRLDTMTHTLTRTTHFSSEEGIEDERQYYNTSLQLHRAATRVLDDTYGAMVRLSCLEHNVVVKAPSGTSKRRTRGDATSLLESDDYGFGPSVLSVPPDSHMGIRAVEVPYPQEVNNVELDEVVGENEDQDEEDVGDSYDMNPEDLY